MSLVELGSIQCQSFETQRGVWIQIRNVIVDRESPAVVTVEQSSLEWLFLDAVQTRGYLPGLD